MSAAPTQPVLSGFHHFSPTVNDIEASAEWYSRVLGLQRMPGSLPHYGSEDKGYAILLMDVNTGVSIGLHHHEDHDQEPADERRTGLDHISFTVADRAALDLWCSWLDAQGVSHSGVIEATEPVPCALVVLRDPDNIQLELITSVV